MISPEVFYNKLKDNGVNFVVGVPDSLLKDFCAFADSVLPNDRHIIAVNEGAAVAIASGVQMATGGLPLVYLQNSGLGNTINPLLSIVDIEVYSIPMILLIGWRGEPGIKDEPQHIKQGRVTISMLQAMEIPFVILTGNIEVDSNSIVEIVRKAKEKSGPVVILVKKDAFSTFKSESKKPSDIIATITRERAIELVTSLLPAESPVIATTGHISRELYEQRNRLNQTHNFDFLTVGGMGHSSQIALGISFFKKNKNVVCLDGDGALLMHMGGMATIASFGSNKFIHVIFNNGVHDSVGGQPTVANLISFTEIAKACAYKVVYGPLYTESDIEDAISQSLVVTGPIFIEIRIKPGARSDLGRPKESPLMNKISFINGID
jgi:phosphonopyruvate decarboxylase